MINILFLLILIVAGPIAYAETKKPLNLKIGTEHGDTFYMQKGVQQYSGEGGEDIYVFDEHSDYDNKPDSIIDFRPEEGDHIVLKNLPGNKVIGSVAKHIVNNKGMVTIKLAGGKKIKLLNLNRTDLKMDVHTKSGNTMLRFSSRFE